jgi:hypothetical protein
MDSKRGFGSAVSETRDRATTTTATTRTHNFTFSVRAIFA